jgi:hypothetical protein
MKETKISLPELALIAGTQARRNRSRRIFIGELRTADVGRLLAKSTAFDLQPTTRQLPAVLGFCTRSEEDSD